MEVYYYFCETCQNNKANDYSQIKKMEASATRDEIYYIISQNYQVDIHFCEHTCNDEFYKKILYFCFQGVETKKILMENDISIITVYNYNYSHKYGVFLVSASNGNPSQLTFSRLYHTGIMYIEITRVNIDLKQLIDDIVPGSILIFLLCIPQALKCIEPKLPPNITLKRYNKLYSELVGSYICE